MSFVDEAKFYVKAGDGGNGCVSFRREKYVPKGGPNGGDGGKGGNVIIKSTKSKNSLIDFKYRSHFKAERGVHGQGKDMHGRKGKSCVMEVPAGSMIRDAETGEILVDLVSESQEYIIAQGGSGGLGNAHFASGANRTPRYASKGREGEERWLKIELKLIGTGQLPRQRQPGQIRPGGPITDLPNQSCRSAGRSSSIQLPGLSG